MTRDFSAAIAQCHATIEMHPETQSGRHFLVETYLALGRNDDALKVLQEHEASAAEAWGKAQFVTIYGRLEDRHSAERSLEQFEALSKTGYVSPTIAAQAYLGLGETEEALTWLERAFHERDVRLIFLGVAPTFDSIRSEPRFKAIVKKMNLPFSM